MRLLLTNDDGVYAQGLHALAKELEKDYELLIVAPEDQRSATSHAITITKPIIVKKVDLPEIKSEAYSVSGTPADCVRVALEKLANGKIDMVFSGTNMGVNLGADVLYSGTVSAAIEANIYGVPSIAVSAELKDEKGYYEVAAKYAKYVLEKAKENFIRDKIILSINVPCLEEEKVKGIKVCKIGGVVYDYYFMENDNDNGDIRMQIKGRKDVKLKEGTDRYYLKEGYVTVTPLHYDLTNFELVEEMKDWF